MQDINERGMVDWGRVGIFNSSVLVISALTNSICVHTARRLATKTSLVVHPTRISSLIPNFSTPNVPQIFPEYVTLISPNVVKLLKLTLTNPIV